MKQLIDIYIPFVPQTELLEKLYEVDSKLKSRVYDILDREIRNCYGGDIEIRGTKFHIHMGKENMKLGVEESSPSIRISCEKQDTSMNLVRLIAKTLGYKHIIIPRNEQEPYKRKKYKSIS